MRRTNNKGRKTKNSEDDQRRMESMRGGERKGNKERGRRMERSNNE